MKENRPMTAKNDNSKSPENMELLQQEASACGPACGCHASGPTSRIRQIIGVIVLVAAAGLVARAMVKNDGASANPTAPVFASVTTTAGTPSPANETVMAVKEITALSELNAVAVDTDAVFVFLPGKGDASGKSPIAQIQGAVRTIESQGRNKVGVFTLKADSPEYEQLAAQTPVPGVLAMVKGRGMSAVSGEITEAKLVQAFVGASSAGGGGCGPSSAGCGPSSAGCGPRR
jgi:hypothetical protein